MGGLGNQLFQCALGIYLSHKHNTELKLDISYCQQKNVTYESLYGLKDFNIDFELIASSQLRFVTQENKIYFKNNGLTIINEQGSWFEPKILDCPDNIYLNGYWQSYKYFENITDIIRKKFTFTSTLHRVSSFWKELIETAECSVSLHIRRSSYMSPHFRKHAGILSLDFYKDCINALNKIYPNITVFVFTNDLDWARQNLRLGINTKFVEGCERDVEELYLMSLCKHNIVANSTFSWWAAWLNLNPNKLVFVPSPWHQDNWGGNTVTPENWIKVSAKFEFTEPVLSIIFFTKDNLSNLNVSLNNVFSQNFKDYEIIVITVEGGESEKIVHKFAAQTNCMILTVPPKNDKKVAWNLGLKCARGEYIMFLEDNDLITPNVTRLVCDCWIFTAKDNLQRDNYLTEKNRENFSPDIIWGSKMLEENLNGHIVVQGLKNKSFIFKDDLKSSKDDNRTFFNLNLNNPDEFKFFFAAILETFIDNKIFKRKFLLENEITFKKNSPRSEILFLVDALFLTKKVTVTTELFLIKLLD